MQLGGAERLDFSETIAKFCLMRHFKLPLIVTGVALLLALIAGIAMVTWIHRSPISDRQKTERAQKLGGATAITILLVIAPFWFIGAARFGKERRAAKDAAQLPPSGVE